MKQYDAIIIGFGKGGKTLAAELAKRKLDVAVVERSEKQTFSLYVDELLYDKTDVIKSVKISLTQLFS